MASHRVAGMRCSAAALAVVFLATAAVANARSHTFFSGLRMPTSADLGARATKFFSGLRMPTSANLDAGKEPAAEAKGTRWALLIAGSNGYGNYRHQADVCHAYQLLKKDGLKDENIVVFMYDDIADNEENPHPGTIINHPHGSDVYGGVPKDYTGEDVTVDNFLAALLGNASAISGGSGKVIASGPDDHVFVFYSDHGGPGILGMPTFPFLLADDVVNTLKKKHKAGGFKELTFYLEACESGSIFEGLLPHNINVYAVTAANAEESSWGCYCPGMEPSPPEEYDTCLGDLFSVAWMEDSDVHNLHKETLTQQYSLVKARTSNGGSYIEGSHVMQYGNKSIAKDEVADFLGSDPANDGVPPGTWRALANVAGAVSEWGQAFGARTGLRALRRSEPRAVDQRDAEILYLERKVAKATDPEKREKAMGELGRAMSHRVQTNYRIGKMVGPLAEAAPAQFMSFIERRPGMPLVDDWMCLRATIRAYESACGPLGQYGMKHTRLFAAACNGFGSLPAAVAAVQEAAVGACGASEYHGPFSV